MSDTAEALPSTLALDAAPPSSRRRVLAWSFWDWGTQPFNSVIITFVFSVYITSAAFGSTNETSLALTVSTTVAGLIVAVIAPVLGARADRTGHIVRNLRWQTWVLAACAGALYFVRPEATYLWLGLGILAFGSIINELAGVNYNATIDQVATGANVGRVSGFGWGMGYIGGIVALLGMYFAFIAPEVGLFGVTGTDGLDIRVSMLACMVWILLFTIPPFLILRDRPATTTERIGVVASYRLLFGTIRGLWRTSRQTVWFLLASALFRDGLTGVFAFGGVIAQGTFGFSAADVIVFGAAANIVAGVSTMLFGLLDDRIGPKTVILFSLASLTVLGILIFIFHNGGTTAFWILGLSLTVFVGPAQAASRSFLARLIPEGRSGEIFGLYATTGRAISFLSPALFGAFLLLGGAITGAENTQYWGILGIVLVLAAGFVALLPVKAPSHHTVTSEPGAA